MNSTDAKKVKTDFPVNVLCPRFSLTGCMTYPNKHFDNKTVSYTYLVVALHVIFFEVGSTLHHSIIDTATVRYPREYKQDHC